MIFSKNACKVTKMMSKNPNFSLLFHHKKP